MGSHYETVKRCLETVSKFDIIKNSEFVTALQYLLTEKFDENSGLIHGRMIFGSIEFRVGTTVFQLRYPPIIPKIIVRYRHIEGCNWAIAEIDNAKEIIDEVLTACQKHGIDSPPGPFSI